MLYQKKFTGQIQTCIIQPSKDNIFVILPKILTE